MKLTSVATTTLALAASVALLTGVTTAGAGSLESPSVQSVTPTQQLTPSAKAQPVRGDFDGDERDDIFWYVPGSGADYLWSGKGRDTSVTDATADRFAVGQLAISGTYTPLVGDFDGNGLDDIFWYGPGAAPDSMWAFTARGTFASYTTSVAGRYTPVVGNFNTTGTSAASDDIFWYSGLATGSSLLSGTSTRGTFTSRSYPSTIAPAGAKVYAGNWRQTPTTPGATAYQDLLFYVAGTTADSIWIGDGTGAFTTSPVTINGTYDLIIGNFDLSTGPAMTDIFWYAPGTAADSVWMNNGSGFASTAQTVNGLRYKPVVLEPEGALAQADILWNNPSGSDFIWKTFGTSGAFAYTSLTPASFGASDPGTRAPIVGDYDYQAPTAVATTGKLTSGDNHSCAITSTNGVKCWGNGSLGRLGNGSTLNSNVPVNVTGLTTGVASVASSAFASHTCAATTAGAVKCWGKNSSRQLGDGTTTNASAPVSVPSLTSGVAAVATTTGSSCALTTTGGVKCWGSNSSGQLGNGTTTNSSVPVDVSGLTTGVASIAGGYRTMCALTTAGGVKCWGSGTTGQLGNGTDTDSNVPVTVTGLTSGVASVSSGDLTTCAVTTSGAAKCWGSNNSGMLGNGTETPSNIPVDVTGLAAGVASIAPGYSHTCATLTTGAATCWGRGSVGQLGNGATASAATPTNVTGLSSGVAALSSGFDTSCALASGTISCWGSGTGGQLGNGASLDSNVPVNVTGGATFAAASATIPGNPANIDILWWAPGNTGGQTEQLWLELENL